MKYVLHDRIVTADRLTLKPVIPATFSVIIGSTTHLQTYDSFYTASPQGWAVRQGEATAATSPEDRRMGHGTAPWETAFASPFSIAASMRRTPTSRRTSR